MSDQAAAVLRADTVVVFVDAADREYRVELTRAGHSNREVRAVAYRWACKQVADGAMFPLGELRFRSIKPLTL